ncbi:uncharacterized protein [Asterias amurensis]|uniref:uncharacterized protein n=1 Tax=Asterias amurensis TaxID=7602 RepID=UPI003AB5E799
MASNIKPDQSVDCPACIANKDPEVRHLEPLDTQDLSVTLQSSGETLSFEEATKTYLQNHYPNLDSTPYSVPPALFYDHKGGRDLKTNEVLSEEIPSGATVGGEEVIDRLQTEAVEKVVQCFLHWKHEYPKGIMVLSEYKMKCYLHHARETGSKKRKTIIDVMGEHDVMVLHPNIGVTFVQVKSVKTTSASKTMRRHTRTAFEQVAKDEKAFREMNADLDFISTVPVVRFVALPNLTRNHLRKMSMCDAHKRQVLTSEDLESPTEFKESVEKWFKVEESFGLENYKDLCGRYIGLASIVKIRTLLDATKKAGVMVRRLLLTPEQNEIIRVRNRRQVIFGDYGTGKSLILAKMAEKIVSEKEFEGIVWIVSCTSINLARWFEGAQEGESRYGRLLNSPSHLVSHFRNLFSEEKIPPSIKIMSIADLYRDCFPTVNPYSQRFNSKLMADLTREVIAKHPNSHIMWDEVPFVLMHDWQDWKPLEKLCVENPRTFVWVSMTLVACMKGNASVFQDDAEYKLKPNFNVSFLTRCMRMTRTSVKLHKALKDPYWNPPLCPMESGNAVNGCVPRWYPLHKCSCGITDLLRCTCFQSQFTNTLKHIWGLINEIDPSSVSFIIGEREDDLNRFLKDSVNKACKTLEIPVDALPTSNDDNHSTQETSEVDASRSKCRIMDSVSCRGCESFVVIIIIEDDLRTEYCDPAGYARRDHLQPMISRALGQTFIITLPQQEVDTSREDNKPNCEPNCEVLASKQVILKCHIFDS